MARKKREMSGVISFDSEVLAQDLDIDSLARDDARKLIPAPDATQPTANELSIVRYFEKKAKEEKKAVLATLSELRKRLSAIYHSRIVEDLKGLPDDLKRINADSRTMEAHAVEILRDQVADRETEVRTFISKNNLNRNPHPPMKPGELSVRLGAIALVEICLSSVILSFSGNLGLFHGVVQIIILSFCNLLGGWLLGRKALPWLNHCHVLNRVVGVCTLLVLVQVIMGINLFAGHCLSSSAPDCFMALRVAMASFEISPFAVLTLKGWILYAVGTLAAGGVTAVGYCSDDPYPGYGKVAAGLTHARQAVLNKQWEHVDVAIANYRHVERRRGHLTGKLIILEERYASLLGDMTRSKEALQEKLGHLDTVCGRMVGQYRVKNRGYSLNRVSSFPPFFFRRMSFGPEKYIPEETMDQEFSRQFILSRNFRRCREEDSPLIQKQLIEIHNEELRTLHAYFLLDEREVSSFI